MKARTVTRMLLLILSVAFASPDAFGLAQTAGEQVRLIGAAVNPNTGGTGSVEIDITRWSTRAEGDRLLAALEEKGQEGLLTALRKNPRVGSIRTPGQLAYDLHYAYRTPLPDGGSQIVIATDRRMSFWELRNQPRSVDYPFTWIQIHINRDGVGEGKMSLATKVIPAGHDLVLENFDLQPVLLSALKEEKLKR